MAIIVSTCSLGHAATNFQQYEQYAFLPNYPGLLSMNPPTDKVRTVTACTTYLVFFSFLNPLLKCGVHLTAIVLINGDAIIKSLLGQHRKSCKFKALNVSQLKHCLGLL